MSLENKVALVTGGGSGIGAAVARTLGARGAKVVVADFSRDSGESVVKSIVADGGQATFIETDVTDAAAVKRMVQAAVDTYGRLDLAHNNAGIVHAAVPLHEIDDATWDRVQNVNTRSVFLCLREEITYFLGAGGGAIVNTASGAGLIAAPLLGAYVTSKHAVVGLTKSAAVENARHNIRVNAVAPSTVETPMTASMTKQQLDDLNESLLIGRMATAQEVANLVVFLLSDEASYINGATYNIDGGALASA